MHRRSCSICVPLSQVLFSLGRHLTKRFRQPQNSRPNYQMLFHFSPRVGRLIGSRWLRHSVLGDPCESVSTSARLLGYSIKAQSVPKRFSSMSVSHWALKKLKQSGRCDWEAKMFLQALHGDVWDGQDFMHPVHFSASKCRS
jgi:hypothetical protein